MNVALGAQEGELPFRFEMGNSGSSHVASPQGGAALRVPVRRLDDLLAAHGVTRISYAKIDVEGFEPAVLQGASRMLAENPRMILQIEVDRRHLMRYGFEPADLAAPLLARGFRPHRLSGDALHAFDASELAFGDVIWIR